MWSPPPTHSNNLLSPESSLAEQQRPDIKSPAATMKKTSQSDTPQPEGGTKPGDEQPWYHQGLQFQCTGCGDCCTGEPGYVWVNQAEIKAMAETLGETDIESFENKFTRRIGIRKSLREFPNGDCVFFDNQTRRCQVYTVRPRQCRTWPFWDSNLKNPAAWKETCEACPGSGTGPLYSLEAIEQQRKVLRM